MNKKELLPNITFQEKKQITIGFTHTYYLQDNCYSEFSISRGEKLPSRMLLAMKQDHEALPILIETIYEIKQKQSLTKQEVITLWSVVWQLEDMQNSENRPQGRVNENNRDWFGK